MKPVHFNDICYLLTHEPFCYTFDQIAQLNPYQVRAILFRKPNQDQKLSFRDAFFLHGRAKGMSEEEIKEKFDQYKKTLTEQKVKKKRKKQKI